MNAELSCYNKESHGYGRSVELSPKFTLHTLVQRHFPGNVIRGRYILPSACVKELQDICLKAMEDTSVESLSSLGLLPKEQRRVGDRNKCVMCLFKVFMMLSSYSFNRYTYYYDVS